MVIVCRYSLVLLFIFSLFQFLFVVIISLSFRSLLFDDNNVDDGDDDDDWSGINFILTY